MQKRRRKSEVSRTAIWRPVEKVVCRKLDDDEMLLIKSDGESASLNYVYALNKEGTWVWERIKEGRSIERLCELAAKDFETPVGVS